MNPVIIAALCVQAFVSRISRLAGALLGYAITTGILIWGLNAYGEGQQIALFGIPVSQGMFVAACIFWYGYDTKHLLAVRGRRCPRKGPRLTHTAQGFTMSVAL